MGIIQKALGSLGYVKADPTRVSKPSFEPRVSQFGFDDSSESPQNERSQLQAYNNHAWLYAGVSAIARNIARLPVKIFQTNTDGSKGEQVTRGWPVEILKNPNPWTNQNKLIYGISSFITLVGDAYLEKQIVGNIPVGLYLLQPTMVEIVKDPQYKIKHYKYTVNNRTIILEPNEVIQFTEFNPLSEYYGTSVVSPLRSTLLSDWYSQAWVKAYFENGPHATGVFTSPNNLDADIFDRLTAVIREKYAGIRKNHKAMFLDNDVKFTKNSIDPKEADLTPIRDMHVREILAVLGVPRMLVQDSKEAAWANADAQLTTFWREKEKPHGDSIADVFNHELFAPYNLQMEFDYSGIEALREDEKILVDMGKVAADTGALTVNEIRERYYKLPAVEWGNEKPNTPAFPIPSQFAMVEKAKQLPKPGKTIEATRDKWMPELFKAVQDHFKTQLSGVLSKFDGFGKEGAVEVRKSVYDVLVGDLNAKTKEMVDKVLKMYEKAGGEFHSVGFDKIKPGIKPAEFLSQSRKDWMQEAVKKFADEIDRTTLEQLRSALEKAVAENKTIPEISNIVKTVFEGTDRAKWFRADMIARTEMLKLENYSAVQGYQDAGATHKTWVAGGPPDDRPNHTAIDGETVPIDQAFSIGLMFPGDPNAPAKEVINCRCSIAPSLEE